MQTPLTRGWCCRAAIGAPEETGGAARSGSFGEAWFPPLGLTVRRERIEAFGNFHTRFKTLVLVRRIRPPVQNNMASQFGDLAD